LKENIAVLMDKIAEDYNRGDHLVLPQTLKNFRDTLFCEESPSYLKIFTRTGGKQDLSEQRAWGFVVKKHSDFKRGDILKAKGWKKPYVDKARGNVLDKDFSWVKWNGPAYMK
tara:strand:+ start:1518 stop:1856 length:339 start_codon:yes stop_codon:yes gene_type:complete